jgi:hypothetical protein
MPQWFKELARCPVLRDVAVVVLTAALKALGSKAQR